MKLGIYLRAAVKLTSKTSGVTWNAKALCKHLPSLPQASCNSYRFQQGLHFVVGMVQDAAQLLVSPFVSLKYVAGAATGSLPSGSATLRVPCYHQSTGHITLS